MIAIDLGGTNLRTALVKNNKIIKIIKEKTPKNKSAIIRLINSSIKILMNKDVIGIGVGSPGPLKNGKILNTLNIDLRNFDLKSHLKKKFKVKVEVENDAKCVALAELHLSTKKKNFFILTLGTGIGGGVIIDGKLFNKEDIGSELGYIYLDKNNSFEDLASSKAVNKLTKKHLGKQMILTDAMKIKNSEKVIDEITDRLAQGIGSLINIFNPEIVVLSGGFTKAGLTFLNLIRKKSRKYILLPKKYNIIYSKLKEPGILGASLLLKIG